MADDANNETSREETVMAHSSRIRPRPHLSANHRAQAKLVPRAVAATLACLLVLAGCSGEPKEVGSPVPFPKATFNVSGWGEPDDKNGNSEQDAWPHILLKMKLKGSSAGAILAIRKTYLPYGAKNWREENMKRYGDPEGSSTIRDIVPFVKPRKIGGRTAYGYSYYHAFFKRWSQAWLVDCMKGWICEIYIESPRNAPNLDPTLVDTALDNIKWAKGIAYG